MFGRFNKIIGGALTVTLVGLGGWSWYQSHTIATLQADNTRLQAVERNLTLALKQEQQAVELQRDLANRLRKQSEGKREKVRVIFKDSPCAGTALPRGVADQLR